jgi:MFS family permease
MTTDTKKGGIHYGWIVMISCCFLLAAGLGIIGNAAANFLYTVSTDLGVPIGTLSLYMTIMSLVMLFSYPFAGKLLATKNLNAVITGGVLLEVIGFGLMSVYGSVYLFYFSGLLIGAGGAVIMFMATPVLTTMWFRKKNGLAMGIPIACGTLGGAIFSLVAGILITGVGWRMSYLILAGIAAVMMLPFSMFVIKTPQQKGVAPYGLDESAEAALADAPEQGATVKQALGSPVFYLLAIAVVAVSIMTTIQMHIPTFASAMLGMSTTEASTVVAIILLVSVVCGPLLGILADKLGYATTFALGAILALAGIILLVFSIQQPGIVMVAAGVYGLGFVTYNVLPPLMTRQIFGTLNYTNIWGYVMMAGSFGGAVGVPVVGYIYDFTGSYAPGFLGVAALLAIGIVCGAIACRLGRAAPWVKG